MRINTTVAVRAAYYDRNPTHPQALFFSTGAIGPATNTVRVTYTVPTGRRAFLQAVALTALRVTVAAPVGFWGVFISVTTEQHQFAAYSFDNTVGARVATLTQGQTMYVAGEAVNAVTIDNSTGGTVNNFGKLDFLEFDA